MPEEFARNAGLSAEEEIDRIMKSVLDAIQQEIKSRFTRLNDSNSKFGFLVDVEKLFNKPLDNDVQMSCKNLSRFYNTDFDGPELYAEICDCKMFLRNREDVRPKTAIEVLTFIISYGEDVFPNLRTALQILLTISVSIASGERSFRKLKLILSFLQANMGQDHLSDLAFLAWKDTFLRKLILMK
ncbi:hypothetical protein AVEN_51920-1 [Araneus ventricosus]|uniref:HAT C-terminal dimerisation domain-containing protein n=1 Tax=Araneus ventricosus TaxID=182803 RepID=A0A4Y2ND47_ARAVE|nr:hypothetical protein AVEN_51920-1 [Araneus ventricosus]